METQQTINEENKTLVEIVPVQKEYTKADVDWKLLQIKSRLSQLDIDRDIILAEKIEWEGRKQSMIEGGIYVE